MPVPLFLRDAQSRALFWEGWLATTFLRDLSRLFRKGFDPNFAFALVEQLSVILKNGELPTTAHLSFRSAAKLKRYLLALESIFVLRRVSCHPSGIGKDLWMLCDSGLADYVLKVDRGEGSKLSLIRHALLNEISANYEYHNRGKPLQYYKSAKGSEVEFVLDRIPIRIVPLSNPNAGPWGWYEKALLGAAKKLGSTKIVMAAPVAQNYREKNTWIGPWTLWS